MWQERGEGHLELRLDVSYWPRVRGDRTGREKALHIWINQFIFKISFNFHIHLIIPILQWVNWGSERLRNLSRSHSWYTREWWVRPSNSDNDFSTGALLTSLFSILDPWDPGRGLYWHSCDDAALTRVGECQIQGTWMAWPLWRCTLISERNISLVLNLGQYNHTPEPHWHFIQKQCQISGTTKPRFSYNMWWPNQGNTWEPASASQPARLPIHYPSCSIKHLTWGTLNTYFWNFPDT